MPLLQWYVVTLFKPAYMLIMIDLLVVNATIVSHAYIHPFMHKSNKQTICKYKLDFFLIVKFNNPVVERLSKTFYWFPMVFGHTYFVYNCVRI